MLQHLFTISFFKIHCSKQVKYSRTEAEADGIKIPKTVEEYCLKHKPIGSQSSEMNIEDDWYDDDEYDDDEDEEDEDDAFHNEDDSGNED